MWEVFDPVLGCTLCRTRWECLAALVAWLVDGDYDLAR